MAGAIDLHLTHDPDADRLLSENPLALLIGMLLDQQVPMEWAFAGPHTLDERLDGPLDAATIAATDPDELEVLFRAKPALHRYPGSMAKRVHALAEHIVAEYDGDPEAIWADVTDGAELKKRLKALPGYGDQKARIFVALLGKQCGVTPDGWQKAAGDYGTDGYRSIADVTSPSTLAKVREFKQAQKAKARDLVTVVVLAQQAADAGVAWWAFVPSLVMLGFVVVTAPVWPYSRGWGWTIAGMATVGLAVAALFTWAWLAS